MQTATEVHTFWKALVAVCRVKRGAVKFEALTLLGVALFVLLGMDAGHAAQELDVKAEVDNAIELLSKTAESQVEQVAKAFGYIKPLPNGEALKRLCEWLNSEEATKRRSAIHIITHLNWEDASPSFVPLRKLLKHEEDITRGMAALALGAKCDTDAYDAIVGLLADDTSAYTRRCAAFALGDMKMPEAIVPLEAAQKKSDDPMVAVNITNAVHRLAFLKKHEGVKGKAKGVVEGIWIIAGSTPNQRDRLEHAMKCINSADAETRRQVYAKALKSPSQYIRNSAMFAAIKNGDPIQVSEADQTYYESIRAILGADKAPEEPTAKKEQDE
jgi:HEAT repeat protein